MPQAKLAYSSYVICPCWSTQPLICRSRFLEKDNNGAIQYNKLFFFRIYDYLYMRIFYFRYTHYKSFCNFYNLLYLFAAEDKNILEII